jgi:uncharacterized protein (DUF1778 family)
MGRPSEDIKKHPLNLRTMTDLERQLEKAANESGRSLEQEVEHQRERALQEVWFP